MVYPLSPRPLQPSHFCSTPSPTDTLPVVFTLPRITQMRLQEQREPFSHPDWLLEVRHDGFRALAYIEHGRCQLRSRRGHIFTWFTPLAHALAEALAVDDAILTKQRPIMVTPTPLM